jgi:GT2 family glycosyltransferase
MLQPLVVTVILNNQRCEDTLACLASLAQSTYPQMRHIVLHLGTVDEMATIQSAYPAAHITHLQDNLGYAGNNNIGIRMALEMGADWVFVLNEDTVIDADCTQALLDGAQQDERIGVLGPTTYQADEPNVIQSAGGELTPLWHSRHLGQNELDAGLSQPRDVSWLAGCALLVRRETLQQVGLLDERFFCYWEEVDWCVRIQQANWRVVHVPAAKLWHKGVQRNYSPKPYVLYYMVRNQYLAMAKSHAPLPAWLRALSSHLRTLISYSLLPKWRAKREFRDAIWHGLVDSAAGRWGKMA